MKHTVFAAASLLLASGCAPRTIDQQAELAALREAANAYHDAASTKQADGSWKVVVDIWNSELPAGR